MKALFAGLVAGLALVAVTLAAPPQQPPARKPPLGTGLIAGKVVEAGSQTPVEAVVTLFGPNDGRRRVMADEQGRYVFTGVAPGQYHVVTAQFGYLGGAFGMMRPAGDWLAIDLGDGQRVLDATVLMWRLVSITGRVLDEAGEPVVGVSVRPFRRDIRHGQVVLEPSFDGYRSVVTDDRGVYRAALLPPGDYAIAVPARVSTFPVEVMRDILESRVDLGVSETAPLGDSRNLQIGNQILATMTASPIPPAREGSPLTVYETTFYPGTPSFDEAAVLPLSAGENRSGVDIRLVAKPTVRVSGQILGPDGLLPMTTFRLVRVGGTPATDSYGLEAATGITDARGQFTLLGVPRGSYVIRVRASRPAASPGAKPTMLAAEHALTVGDADVADVVVAARRAATISGHVEIRGAQPIAVASLLLGIDSFRLGESRELRIDKDYQFSVELPPGRYFVQLYAGADACTSTSGGRTISDDSLEVGQQNISDVVIVCGEPASHLRGFVRDDHGQLDPRARVVAFSTDRRFWSGVTYRQRRRAEARVTLAATFDIPNLPPGEYFVVAIPETATSDWQLPAVRDALVAAATRVTIGAGESRAIDLRTVVIK